MFYFACFVMLCMLFPMKLRFAGIFKNYCDVAHTNVVKGIFILCVFMSHIRTYVDYTSFPDSLVVAFLNYLSQLMVTLFLFYSGYGVFESIKKKGKSYLEGFFSKRILKTFYPFAIMVCIYTLVCFLTGRDVSFMQWLLSLVGLKSVGNSNWYMFAIFVLYILTWMSFALTKDNRQGVICMTILSLVYVLIVMRLLPSRFSNTFLCYGAGMWYSYFKDRIDAFFEKDMHFYIGYALFALCFVYVYLNKGQSIWIYNVLSMIFCLLVVMTCMKVDMHNAFLMWCGKNLFWLYIIQRIPMILLKHYDLMMQPTLNFVACFVVTVVATYIREKVVS